MTPTRSSARVRNTQTVLGEFSPDGIAGRMYEGYEARAEQLEMAGAVLEAFRTRTHAAIEAGTGVGKSVAYLVPAALYSLQNGVGVGVATKTNALMDQLVYHELPKLNAGARWRAALRGAQGLRPLPVPSQARAIRRRA